MVLLAFDQALKNIQNNGDDRKLIDCFYDYKVNGLTFHHSGNSYITFSYYDFDKSQRMEGTLRLEYQCEKKFFNSDGKKIGGCTFPLGTDVGQNGDDFLDIDTSSPVPSDSVSLRAHLEMEFNRQKSDYTLEVSEDITDKNRHMSIKQMAAHLASVFCEQLDKNTQNTDSSQFGAQLTKMLLKLGRSDVFDGPELDRAYQIEEHRQTVLQRRAQRQSETNDPIESRQQPKVQQHWFGNEFYGKTTLLCLKQFAEKTPAK